MKSIVDILATETIKYYARYTEYMRDDILHTQEVVSYTRLIAIGGGLDADQVARMECAAWLHDIGCPRSKQLYGDSRPEYQQRVGRVVASEMLHDIPEIDDDTKCWLVDVVGTHHQAHDAERLEFQPLFEADLIVNILSGYHSREKAPMLYKKLIKSASGQELFRTLIGATE